MRQLQKTIKTNGHVYQQLERTEKTALYAQYTKDGILAGHECFVIKIGKPIVMPDGRELPLREKFPADRDFGITAWSVGIDETRALKRFKEITNFAKERKTGSM